MKGLYSQSSAEYLADFNSLDATTTAINNLLRDLRVRFLKRDLCLQVNKENFTIATMTALFCNGVRFLRVTISTYEHFGDAPKHFVASNAAMSGLPAKII